MPILCYQDQPLLGSLRGSRAGWNMESAPGNSLSEWPDSGFPSLKIPKEAPANAATPTDNLPRKFRREAPISSF